MYNIYKITNSKNKKVYIGLTTTGLGVRKSHHKYRFLNKVRDHKLYRAFEKYGWDSFDWEILAFVHNIDQLKCLERIYIDLCDSFNCGYNMTEGGDSITPEIASKISNTLTGTKHDRERVEKRRRTVLKNGTYVGKKNSNYGNRGALSHFSKLYIVTEPDGTEHFVHGLHNWCKNWKKASLDSSTLVKCARGKRRTDKGYKCRYYKERATTSRKTYTQAGGSGEYPIRVMR